NRGDSMRQVTCRPLSPSVKRPPTAVRSLRGLRQPEGSHMPRLEETRMETKRPSLFSSAVLVLTVAAGLGIAATAGAADKRPNIVMLMTDDTGWTDFGAYLGGAALGHPTPNIDRIAKEGA